MSLYLIVVMWYLDAKTPGVIESTGVYKTEQEFCRAWSSFQRKDDFGTLEQHGYTMRLFIDHSESKAVECIVSPAVVREVRR